MKVAAEQYYWKLADNPFPEARKKLNSYHCKAIIQERVKPRKSEALVSGKGAGNNVVNVRLERGFESVFPPLELSQDGDIVGVESMFTRHESIAKLPHVNKLGDLRLPHDQLCATLNRFVIVGKPVGKRVPGIIRPLDDFE